MIKIVLETISIVGKALRNPTNVNHDVSKTTRWTRGESIVFLDDVNFIDYDAYVVKIVIYLHNNDLYSNSNK